MIRNGFIKSYEGEWYSLRHIVKFYVRFMQKAGYEICLYIVTYNDAEKGVVLEKDFDTYEEAIDRLNEIMDDSENFTGMFTFPIQRLDRLEKDVHYLIAEKTLQETCSEIEKEFNTKTKVTRKKNK